MFETVYIFASLHNLQTLVCIRTYIYIYIYILLMCQHIFIRLNNPYAFRWTSQYVQSVPFALGDCHVCLTMNVCVHCLARVRMGVRRLREHTMLYVAAVVHGHFHATLLPIQQIVPPSIQVVIVQILSPTFPSTFGEQHKQHVHIFCRAKPAVTHFFRKKRFLPQNIVL